MRANEDCSGWVDTLAGQRIQFSGVFYSVDGKQWLRTDREARVRRLGVAEIARSGTRGLYLDLVIVGDLSRVPRLSDPGGQASKHGAWVARERAKGNHICLVDAAGFTELLEGHPAPCLEPVVISGDKVRIEEPENARVRPAISDRFGRVLPVGTVAVHSTEPLTTDLAGLDRGSLAHHTTVEALRAHIRPHDLLGPVGSPLFDAAWRDSEDPGVLFVAEVKSLTGARQDQQIRLGIGQLLDYAHSLRLDPSAPEIRPVLVLDRRPSDARFEALAASLGIVLTWGPDFPGVPVG